MQLGSQTLRPNVFHKHLVKRAYAKKRSRKALLAALSLTSMVDMFSLLVIFLLQTFSTSPELLLVSKGVELPVAISGAEIADAPVLALTNGDVFLDQKRVGSVDEVLKNPEGLLKGLEGFRELWQKSHPDGTFKGEINLQAHKSTSSTVVSQVMGILPSQQYGSIQLVVTSGNR
jgi:biopolymer transport protein ExbD